VFPPNSIITSQKLHHLGMVKTAILLLKCGNIGHVKYVSYLGLSLMTSTSV